MDDLKKQLSQPSIESKQEWVGKLISYLAIILISSISEDTSLFLQITKKPHFSLPNISSEVKM